MNLMIQMMPNFWLLIFNLMTILFIYNMMNIKYNKMLKKKIYKKNY